MIQNKNPTDILETVILSSISLNIILYVDDLLITGSLASKIKELFVDRKTTFEMTDLGLLHYVLGMEVHQ